METLQSNNSHKNLVNERTVLSPDLSKCLKIHILGATIIRMSITLLNHLLVKGHIVVPNVKPTQKTPVFASATNKFSPNRQLIITSQRAFEFRFEPVGCVDSKSLLL